MPVNFGSDADVETIEFKKFLIEANKKDIFQFIPPTPVGYLRDNEREGSIRPKSEEFTYIVRENWKLYERGHVDSSGEYVGGELVGIHTPEILEQRDVGFSTNFVLFLKSGISDTAVDHARQLLETFPAETENTTEADILQWISDNIGDELKPDDFILETKIVAKAMDSQRQFDTSQRDALFKLFEQPGGSRIPVIHENEERGLGGWAESRSIGWKLGRRGPVTNDQEPTNTASVYHVPEGDDPESYDPTTIISDIVDEYKEPDCDGMKTYKEKLLVIGQWPEFKIKWKIRTIKIGCCKVKTKIPQAYKRIGKLVFYGYYRVPQNLGLAILKIAESCLIKTALTSAIIGILTSNLAAAIRVFVPLYKQCLIEEAKECIYPGLMLIQESGKWKPL